MGNIISRIMQIKSTVVQSFPLNFAPLSILPFGPGAASEYGEIRTHLQGQGTPIGPMDLLIAAHARAEGLVLVTNNVREFERVPGLELENWAE